MNIDFFAGYYKFEIKLPSIVTYNTKEILKEKDIMLFFKERNNEEQIFNLEFYLYKNNLNITDLYNKPVIDSTNEIYYIPTEEEYYLTYNHVELCKYLNDINKEQYKIIEIINKRISN